MTMQFTDYRYNHEKDLKAARAAEQRLFDAVRQLELEKNVMQLEVQGYTILTPEQIGQPDLAVRMRDKIIYQLSIDLKNGLSRQGESSVFASGLFLPNILHEDRVFEEALLNEPMLALVTYLCGESCHLSNYSAMVKDRGERYLTLHTDHIGVSTPMPTNPVSCNATYLLTDYSPDDGSICFVPGSHKLRRHPTAAEATDPANYVGITAPAGSVIIWGANTWHGALPRKNPGVRISAILFFSRWYFFQNDPDMASRVTPDVLERNPRRFRRLVGLDKPLDAYEDFAADDERKTMRETDLSPYA